MYLEQITFPFITKFPEHQLLHVILVLIIIYPSSLDQGRKPNWKKSNNILKNKWGYSIRKCHKSDIALHLQYIQFNSYTRFFSGWASLTFWKSKRKLCSKLNTDLTGTSSSSNRLEPTLWTSKVLPIVSNHRYCSLAVPPSLTCIHINRWQDNILVRYTCKFNQLNHIRLQY